MSALENVRFREVPLFLKNSTKQEPYEIEYLPPENDKFCGSMHLSIIFLLKKSAESSRNSDHIISYHIIIDKYNTRECFM